MINHLITDKPMRAGAVEGTKKKVEDLSVCRLIERNIFLFDLCPPLQEQQRNKFLCDPQFEKENWSRPENVYECYWRNLQRGPRRSGSGPERIYWTSYFLSSSFVKDRTFCSVRVRREEKKNLRNRYLSSLFSEGDEDGDNFLCPCGFCLTNPPTTFRLVQLLYSGR